MTKEKENVTFEELYSTVRRMRAAQINSLRTKDRRGVCDAEFRVDALLNAYDEARERAENPQLEL